MGQEYKNIQKSTIAAIATPTGAAAVGMIRVSGCDAFDIVDRVFNPITKGGSLSQREGYTGCLGIVTDEQGPIDEVVAFIYTAPRSYTGENIVELCCHGSSLLVGRVLEAVLGAGAHPAGPGEFTRRAFENGKMSLDRAEGVMALITAQSEGGARAAFAAKDGALWKEISDCAEGISDIAAHLSAWLDYPDEGVEDVDKGHIKQTAEGIKERLFKLQKTYSTAKVLREGVDVVIAGRPNVGKSTLMNLLSGGQRSIVTDIPGTTRDVVEDRVYLGEFLLRLSDTAGLRKTDDPVEMIGVERARDRMQGCDIVMAMFDHSLALDREDFDLINMLKNRPAIAIINKTDLAGRLEVGKLREGFTHVVEMSAQEGSGVEALEQALTELLEVANLDPSAAVLVTARQLDCVGRAVSSLDEALLALGEGHTFDAVWVCLEEALGALLELTGQRATSAVIDKVFEKFCVGK